MTRTYRVTLTLAAAMVAAMLVADTAQTQNRGRRGGFFRDGLSTGVRLLRVEAVQKELKLTETQIASAKEHGEKLTEQQRALTEGLTREQRGEKREELSKKARELAWESVKKIAESMDDGQKKRWRELSLQSQGATALSSEYLAERLKLTDDQKKKLEEIQSTQRDTRRKTFQSLRDQNLSREEMTKKFSELREADSKARLAVLTNEQRESFTKMQGEKFDFPPRRQFGRRQRNN